jgi:uncharacterized membrane protein YphA (DoxX/SURF4 family)
MKPTVILFWLARIVAALIMLQTLYFKFSASAESVFIFTTVGMEPWGRWLVGALELVASILLFIPAMVWLGAILAIGLMAGAIGMHVTLLGIEVQGDGGQLFMYAAIVLVCASYVFWIRRKTIPVSLQKWLPSFLK